MKDGSIIARQEAALYIEEEPADKLILDYYFKENAELCLYESAEQISHFDACLKGECLKLNLENITKEPRRYQIRLHGWNLGEELSFKNCYLTDDIIWDGSVSEIWIQVKPEETAELLLQYRKENRYEKTGIISGSKKVTSGYLAPEVYREIYQTALESPEGMIVDIGPAQGGSTISLGLAAKDSGRKGKIYSIDVFQKSAALKSYDNVEENVVNLYENVEHYGLKDFVEVRVVGRDDTMLTKEMEPVSVLFIDADGAIDRDFEAFYNRLLPGAGIIIDDCENVINLQAKTRFLKWQTKMQEECFLKSLGLSDLESYTPLGKQYTTYQFVSYLKKNGYIEETKNMNGTIFARKPAAAPVF